MKILVVEIRDAFGHRTFDKIHVEAMALYGADLVLASKYGYFDYIKEYLQDRNVEYVYIPSFLFRNFKSGITAQVMVRIVDILKLLFIRWVSYRYKVDGAIFLYYDILSFFVYRTSKPVVLINHTNVDELKSGIKLFLTKHLPKHYIHVNLNSHIDNRMKELLPDVSSVVIPHGFLSDIAFHKEDKLEIKFGGKCIFCPLSPYSDVALLKKLFSSSVMNDYIVKNNFVVLMKGNYLKFDSVSWIIELPNYIESDLYNNIMTNSYAIFLPYGNTFRYRVSGILHECISYNTPVICGETESFLQYKDFINYNYLVNDDISFINVLNEIAKSNKYYKNLEKLSTTEGWALLLNSLQS